MKILVCGEIALEEAVRLRERGADAEIVAVGVGGAACEVPLRAALARGADRALLVLDDDTRDPGVLSHLLAAAARRENPDLILMDGQAGDADLGQAGPRLAAQLGMPQATFIDRIDLFPDRSRARVTREVDAGRETLAVTLPAVITTDLLLNEPRPLSLPAILQARTKPLERIASSEFGPRPLAPTILLRQAAPPRRPGRKLRSVDELIAVLRTLTGRPPNPTTHFEGTRPFPASFASAHREGGRGVRWEGGLLVLAETDGVRVLPSTLPAIAFAQTFAGVTGAGFDLLLVGGPKIAAAAEAWRGYGAGRVLVAAAPELAHPTADRVAAVCVAAMRQAGASWLAGPSSTFGRDILPRVAGLLDLPMISDVIDVEMQIAGDGGVFSVRGPAFGETETVGEKSIVEGLPVDAASLPQGTQRIALIARSQGRRDLTMARVVVAGGRPLRDAATFERLIGGLADKLGGAVGASGGATAADLADPALLIGQTGETIAPDLYLAVGISGADQHVAGMKDSKIIVAINRDPDAPIFRIADYGLVADLHEAVPELIEKL